jgi:predicted SprT family Zn-dependent metalloprotease
MNITGKMSKKQKLAIQFFADKLLSKQMQRHVSIAVSFITKTQTYGEIGIEDYNSTDQPRGFKIYVNRKTGDEEILKTIAHEMVHLKQYCKKELNEEMTHWKGQRVSLNKIPYFERPWEIEAHEIGDKIYEEFICQTVVNETKSTANRVEIVPKENPF